MKKRHRTIDPKKARAAAGGGIGEGWYQQLSVADNRATCSRCEIRTALIGLDGECLRCRLERKREAQAGEAVPFE